MLLMKIQRQYRAKSGCISPLFQKSKGMRINSINTGAATFENTENAINYPQHDASAIAVDASIIEGYFVTGRACFAGVPPCCSLQHGLHFRGNNALQ